MNHFIAESCLGLFNLRPFLPGAPDLAHAPEPHLPPGLGLLPQNAGTYRIMPVTAISSCTAGLPAVSYPLMPDHAASFSLARWSAGDGTDRGKRRHRFDTGVSDAG